MIDFDKTQDEIQISCSLLKPTSVHVHNTVKSFSSYIWTFYKLIVLRKNKGNEQLDAIALKC